MVYSERQMKVAHATDTMAQTALASVIRMS